MKKFTAILLVLISIFALAGCGGIELGSAFTDETDNYEGVSMTLTGTVGPGAASVIVTNDTGEEVYSGNEHVFGVHVEKDGVWYSIAEKGEFATTAEAMIFEPGVQRQLDMSWGRRYGSLPKGHYRIVKNFFTDSGADFLLTAEFELK